jgi:hypothetical protein
MCLRHWGVDRAGPDGVEPAEEIVQGIVPMRSLDAIHVAFLVTFQAVSGTRIPFVTGNDRQREAATYIGLDVVWIGP